MSNDTSIEYKNAYTEVLAVLSNMLDEDYNKIPKDIIKVFETFKNNDYTFKYDISKDFKEQGLSKEAKLVLAYLYRDYWAEENEKKEILLKQNTIRKELEEEKRKKYNPDVFKDKCKFVEPEEIKIVTQGINTIESEETVLKKIINRIKNVFNKIINS